ncbi:hypothetical protein MKY14_08070 [Paenibacillus sp. FSL R5-0887]|uniref:hypothetical protein n=1 Tax=Paenibacillus sp. FSL R5-0887 TaxID=2921662 RepID=UPI0030FCF5E2
MNKQKMIHINWTEQEASIYYVVKDGYSKAHDNGETVTLNGFSGVYTFNKQTKTVTLNTGTEMREITVTSWKFFEAPTPV